MDKLTSILAVVQDIGHGDRAFDKAMALAHATGAHVDCLPAASTSAILRRAAILQPDIVIKAASAPHPLRRFTLGDSDWELAAQCPGALMLVRERAWRAEMRLAAAVDVSDSAALDVARGILYTAGFLTLDLGAELDVFYSEREQRDETVRMSRAVRLAQMVREFHVGGERIRHLNGDPQRTLPPSLARGDYDCIVLGSAMPGGLRSVLGGMSSLIADAVDGDIVFVKPREGRRTARAARRHDARPELSSATAT